LGGAARSPSNIMWPVPMPTCLPSFILIHRKVWSQYTNVTDRTDRQDRQLSDSIGLGRTVLQTVAQRFMLTVDLAFGATHKCHCCPLGLRVVQCCKPEKTSVIQQDVILQWWIHERAVEAIAPPPADGCRHTDPAYRRGAPKASGRR